MDTPTLVTAAEQLNVIFKEGNEEEEEEELFGFENAAESDLNSDVFSMDEGSESENESDESDDESDWSD